jgi:hypothetical protein
VLFDHFSAHRFWSLRFFVYLIRPQPNTIRRDRIDHSVAFDLSNAIVLTDLTNLMVVGGCQGLKNKLEREIFMIVIRT